MPDRRSITSAENGRKSKGPVTPAGKDRSKRNAIRHGVLARFTVVDGEKRETFENTVASYYNRFQPQDDPEEDQLDEMASAIWRIRRAAAVETSLMDREIKRQTSSDELQRLAGAFEFLAGTPQYKVLMRYESALHRKFHRSMQALKQLKQIPMPAGPVLEEPRTAKLPEEPEVAPADNLPADNPKAA